MQCNTIVPYQVCLFFRVFYCSMTKERKPSLIHNDVQYLQIDSFYY
jgi:hypothetical protein